MRPTLDPAALEWIEAIDGHLVQYAELPDGCIIGEFYMPYMQIRYWSIGYKVGQEWHWRLHGKSVEHALKKWRFG